ncbi:MAG: glycosyl transferase family 2 [Saprospiraceae bacterium]|nr:MAG: glycosyl transferase family 2 [Saprospiraceae bacterium]
MNIRLTKPAVSIVICEHDDGHKLLSSLDRFLNQTGRSFELVVISHNSSFPFEHLLAPSHRQTRHLRTFRHDDGRIGKKFPLTRGVEEARFDYLLLTDADCQPASLHWMDKMATKLDDGAQIVLGFAPYLEAPGFLNKFIRFETCYTAIQYLSFALAGLPYMGVGRNLAYTKTLFRKTGGFASHTHIASGDDDLFVNAAARPHLVSIQLDPDTFVYSPAKKSWKAWYRQKSRHLTTGRLYKLHHRLLLGLLAMSHTLHYVGGVLMATIGDNPFLTLTGYVVRMSVVVALGSVLLSRLQHRNLRPWVPALDALMGLYYLAFAPRVLWNTNTQRWN